MTFNAQVFRVFIASPSDLTEERDAATEAVVAAGIESLAARIEAVAERLETTT